MFNNGIFSRTGISSFVGVKVCNIFFEEDTQPQNGGNVSYAPAVERTSLLKTVMVNLGRLDAQAGASRQSRGCEMTAMRLTS